MSCRQIVIGFGAAVGQLGAIEGLVGVGLVRIRGGIPRNLAIGLLGVGEVVLRQDQVGQSILNSGLVGVLVEQVVQGGLGVIDRLLVIGDRLLRSGNSRGRCKLGQILLGGDKVGFQGTLGGVLEQGGQYVSGFNPVANLGVHLVHLPGDKPVKIR